MAAASNNDLSLIRASKEPLSQSHPREVLQIFKRSCQELVNCRCPDRCKANNELQDLISKMYKKLEDLELNGCFKSSVLTRQSSCDFSSVVTEKHDHADWSYPIRNLSSSKPPKSVLSRHPSIDGQSVYKVRKGYMLLVVNVWFEGRLDARNGAGEEAAAVKKFFESFHFFVDDVYNLRRDEISQHLQQLAQSALLDGFDCFAFVMMSHGGTEGIYGTDNLPADYDDIVNKLKGNNCKSLIGKPKLFFFQSCRGLERDKGQICYLSRGGPVHDGGNKEKEKCPIPTDSDILLVHATTLGRLAHKDILTTVNGRVISRSWLFEAIFQVFNAYAEHEDLMAMMTRVNSHVSIMGNSERGVQVPCQLSTLTKKVFLTKEM